MNNIICAILKNEHLYLDEWITYHLNIGFNHIYLFEDYGSQSHKEITDKYENVTLKTLYEFGIDQMNIPSHGCLKQGILYNKFLQEYRNSIDWLAFIDIDEFISFGDGYDLQKINEEFKDENGVYMCWQNYGANGNIYYSSEKVQERFITPGQIPDPDLVYALKAFLNLNKYNGQMLDLHHAEGLCNTFHLKTQRLIKNYHKIYIKHYFTKSWEEWCNRWTRGDMEWGARRINYFFEVNPDMLDKYAELHELARKQLGEELYNKMMYSNINFIGVWDKI